MKKYGPVINEYAYLFLYNFFLLVYKMHLKEYIRKLSDLFHNF